MKQTVRALVVMSLVLFSHFAGAGARENARLQEGKITKNEAQHLVLKEFPGATIKQCVLAKGGEHSVWNIDLIKPGSNTVTKVKVDGESGQLIQ